MLLTDVNIALERTLKLKLKTMGSSTCKKSLYFNKTILFCPAIGGPGPPGPPCLRQWGWSKNWGLEPLSPIASAATDGLRPGLGCGLGIQRFTAVGVTDTR